MKLQLWPTLAILLLPLLGFSQSLEKVLEKGDEAYSSRDYYTAYKCYEVVLEYPDDAYSRPQRLLAYQFGISAQRFNYLAKADSVFANLMVASEDNNRIDSIYARTVYYRAQTLLSKGRSKQDYQIAESLFRKVVEGLHAKVSADAASQNRYLEAAKAGLKKVQYGIRNDGWIEKDTLHRLTYTGLNSPFSDLAPVAHGDTLYFSSLRFDPNPIRLRRQSTTYSKNMKAIFTDMDTMGIDTSVFELPVNERFNEESYFTLHHAVSKDHKWLVFSSCKPEKDTIRCQLYKRQMLADGQWGPPQPLDTNTPANFTATQPAFAADCETGGQKLYFASDRPGTFGGLDLWVADFDTDSGTLADISNLDSPINSAWNESTPFFHEISKTLYFSSDAPPGFGNYDIFSSQRKGGGWEEPVNMGSPYNTGFNDMYFFLSPEGRKVYLSSDRPRSTRFDEAIDACCQDIYTGERQIDRNLAVELLQCDMAPEGYTPSKLTIVDISNCASPDTLLDISTLEDIVDTFRVKHLRQYHVRASNDFYQMEVDTVIDFRAPRFDTLQTAALAIDFLPGYVELDIETGFFYEGALINIGEVEVQDYGGNIVSNQANSQEDRFRFRLEYDKSYEVGITVDSTENTVEGDIEGGDITLYPDTLEGVYFPSEICRQVCFDEVEIPLPAKLTREAQVFFHNDKPDRETRSVWDVTDQSLEDAIDEYLELETTYKAVALETQNDTVPVGLFFRNEVANGLTEVKEMAQYLIDAEADLKEGQQIEVEIQGLCSAKGNPDYNDALAVRRIQCIREFMEEQTKDGKRLGDLMGEVGSGKKIIITPKPLGESQASGNYPVKVGGIYNIGAALDRRVKLNVVLPRQSPAPLSVFDLDEDCTQTNNVTRKNPEQ